MSVILESSITCPTDGCSNCPSVAIGPRGSTTITCFMCLATICILCRSHAHPEDPLAPSPGGECPKVPWGYLQTSLKAKEFWKDLEAYKEVSPVKGMFGTRELAELSRSVRERYVEVCKEVDGFLKAAEAIAPGS